jgi:L-seryl-tRNA(Ser) seleniumtransferase
VAALEATLAGPPAPVAEQLSADPADLANRARQIASALASADIDARVEATAAAVGGGGAPGVPLPSAAVSLPTALAVPLRAGQAVRGGALPAVVGRIEDGRLLLDLRAVAPADDDLIVSAVRAAAG